MLLLLKIVGIFSITALSLILGGWIASHLIKMDSRINLIDW